MSRPRLFLLFGCLSLACAVTGRAQIPQVTPPPLNSLPSNPTAALPLPPPPGAPANGRFAPAAGAAPERADVRMQYPNASVTDIMTVYETLTGKRLIADSSVQGQINIMINKMVTREEAVRILETSLNLNGFTLVQGSGDIIKVLGLGKPVRNFGVPIYSDLAMVPESEQSVSFFLRLRYLDALEVSGVLTQYIPPNSNSIAFTPLPKSGAVIITDTANSVRRIVTLLSQIDTPSSPVVEKFIRLERADATKAVEFLNSVFETKTAGASPGAPGNPQGANGVNVRRPIRRLNEEGQPVFEPVPGQGVPAGLIALNGDSIIQGRVTLTADVRTNRIHVVTQPDNLKLIETLVAEYDSDTPFAAPVKRPLRFVAARDVLPILVQALTEPGSENSGGAAGGTPGAPARQQNNNNSQNNLFNNNSNSNGNSFGSSSGGSGNSSIGSEGLNTEAVDTTPTEAVVGSTKIIADQRSNTIILLGGAEAKDKVFQVLDQLDVRAPQVIIRAIIGELSLGKNTEMGINYLLRRKGLAAFSQFNSSLASGTANASTTTTTTGTGTGSTFNSTNSSTLQTLSNLAAGLSSGFSGLGGIVSIGNSFDIILSALESTNRFKTISRPMIFTSNNKKAIIASGQEIAVPTQSLSSFNGSTVDSNAAVSTNVQFKDVTLQLEVVPLINSEREVTLDILQKIDSVVAGQNVQVGGNSIPTIATRYIKSNVSMPNGSTVVLGGLITQSDNKTFSDVPYLSKLPWVGDLLFKSRTHDQNRSELIVLLHPDVVNTPGLLDDKRNEEEQRLYLEPGLEDQLTAEHPVKRATTVTSTTRTTKTVLRAQPVLPSK